MLKGQRITLIAIAFNEEKLIVPTIKAVPDYVDNILIVDDCSTDSTPDLVKEYASIDPRVHLIRHKQNRGPGGAIISGYLWFYLQGDDIAVVVGGDNQMDQNEMVRFILPLTEKRADYCKGNRFLVDAFSVMPLTRLVGNISLSLMTVFFSGYWGIFDTQDGYTSISRDTVGRIDWRKFFEGYGYVSDFIIRMKPFGIRIEDVPRRSIYLPGERQSQIKIAKYVRKFFPLWMSALKGRLSKTFHPSEKDVELLAMKRRAVYDELA
jgi:glycosyltransferase involved in cell wall biosynthesis